MSFSVSVIVVNRNGRLHLVSCLEQLSRQSLPDYRIILVDNDSTDDSVSFTRLRFPEVEIVLLPKNTGFTGGNMAGLGKTDSRFVALLNNDTEVSENWLENLVRPMMEDPCVGICASKIVFTGAHRLNSAGDGITVAGVGCNRGLDSNPTDFEIPGRVFGACGAAVLYRREMLDEIGFLDEDFFLYDEDTDLNFRAQLAGWKCVYVPTAVVQHIGNATSGRLSDIHVYYHARNLEFVWIKNMPTGLMLRFAHHKIVQEIGSFCYLCLRHGKWRAFFHAKWDALRMLPHMWTKRRDIQVRRRVSNNYIRGLMTSMFSLEFACQKARQLIRG